MKHLITMTACLLLLMALLSQFVQNQQLLLQLEAGSQAVNHYCENGDEAGLRDTLSRIMDCEIEEIVIEREADTLVISTPVKSILATPAFWGVSPEENCGNYCWEREASNG